MNYGMLSSGKKLIHVFAVLSLFSLFAVSCVGASPVGKTNGTEAKNLLASNPLAIILDVRTKEEFDTGYISGAKLLPYDAINASSAAKIAPNKNEPIIVYCRSGRRSAVAVDALKALGYQKVFDLGAVGNWTFGLVK